MKLLLIFGAVGIVSTLVYFFFPRKMAKKASQEPAGAVSCKKCGARIAVSNPSKLRQEFSVKCTACDTRKVYVPVDLAQ
jgi:hypothetical protein